ncbi:sigma-70 family RNA polymerase sigma factor [Granulicella sp. WH15]|uniref:RNA polymerase sigma factor n=1 Tax=Granulicella sp. WH15 TaxID=2602070 RepID=UPI0013A536AE|nr:sigma-70 family RNA polymerase sigma factor [Granulicella sp. WH15]
MIPIEEKVPSSTDESLMAALKERDQDALSELFRRYSRLVFSMAYRILHDAGEAEEIVQDVFLYLYQKAAQFDQSKGSAKTWIVQVTHSRSLDRRDFLHRRHFYLGTDVADLANTLAGTNDVEHHIVSKWNLAQLQIALCELPEKQRRTLQLFFFEGLELKEIAGQLGESPENVRHHYYRGLQKLRKNGIVQELKDTEKE